MKLRDITYQQVIHEYAYEMGRSQMGRRDRFNDYFANKIGILEKTSSWESVLSAPLTLAENNKLVVPLIFKEDSVCQTHLDDLCSSGIKVDELKAEITSINQKAKEPVESLMEMNKIFKMEKTVPEEQATLFWVWTSKTKKTPFKPLNLVNIQSLVARFKSVDFLINEELKRLAPQLGIDFSGSELSPFQQFKQTIDSYGVVISRFDHKCRNANTENDVLQLKDDYIALQPSLEHVTKLVAAVLLHMKHYDRIREEYLKQLFSIYSEPKRYRLFKNFGK